MTRDDAWLPSLAADLLPTLAGSSARCATCTDQGEGHPLPTGCTSRTLADRLHRCLSAPGPMPGVEGPAAYPFLQARGRPRVRDPRRTHPRGLIEPGHFRFSVVGETILRMKATLWFVHRGIEKPRRRTIPGRSPGDHRAHLRRHSGGSLPRLRDGGRGRAGHHGVRRCAARTGQLLECERIYPTNTSPTWATIINDVALQHRLPRTQPNARTAVAAQRAGDRPFAVAGPSRWSARLVRRSTWGLVAASSGRPSSCRSCALGHSVVADRLHGTPYSALTRCGT